ncbi:uncharacterized protein LOC109513416 isoform X2 [Hippocampus comes]|uniref:uncharacterized protein LOC109513416 isoform X2 n=1 Tax=Hippocampus comes TaxID=109280 RepID=UPI00094EC292|nr:PREDICTED: uncharacterized protein LOC109513416 isoform X2 [Hippocampus comes]
MKTRPGLKQSVGVVRWKRILMNWKSVQRPQMEPTEGENKEQFCKRRTDEDHLSTGCLKMLNGQGQSIELCAAPRLSVVTVGCSDGNGGSGGRCVWSRRWNPCLCAHSSALWQGVLEMVSELFGLSGSRATLWRLSVGKLLCRRQCRQGWRKGSVIPSRKNILSVFQGRAGTGPHEGGRKRISDQVKQQSHRTRRLPVQLDPR